MVICFLMARYQWSFNKTLEYLDSKRSNLEIKGNYFNPLQAITANFERYNDISGSWHNDYKSSPRYREEELIMTNTFLNTQKIKLNWLVLDYFIKKKRNKTCDKKIRKVVKWADRIKKEKKKAKSVQKVGKIFHDSDVKKPKTKKKKKFRTKNVKTELNESYDDSNAKLSIFKQKYKSLEMTELHSKKLKQFEGRKYEGSNKVGKSYTNNSLSKSTNVQEDVSNTDKNESKESKKDQSLMLKESGLEGKNVQSFRNSFLNDIKFPKSRKTNLQFFSEIEKQDKSKATGSRDKRNIGKSIFSDKFEKLMRNSKIKGKKLKLSNIEAKGDTKERNISLVQQKDNSRLRDIKLRPKPNDLESNKLKTQLLMKKLFEQNKKYNRSIEPRDKEKSRKLLKSNKNSEYFFKSKNESQKRPSSAPNKDELKAKMIQKQLFVDMKTRQLLNSFKFQKLQLVNSNLSNKLDKAGNNYPSFKKPSKQ